MGYMIARLKAGDRDVQEHLALGNKVTSNFLGEKLPSHLPCASMEATSAGLLFSLVSTHVKRSNTLQFMEPYAPKNNA